MTMGSRNEGAGAAPIDWEARAASAEAQLEGLKGEIGKLGEHMGLLDLQGGGEDSVIVVAMLCVDELAAARATIPVLTGERDQAVAALEPLKAIPPDAIEHLQAAVDDIGKLRDGMAEL